MVQEKAKQRKMKEKERPFNMLTSHEFRFLLAFCFGSSLNMKDKMNLTHAVS